MVGKKSRTRCIRCGLCCRSTSPTLQLQDIHLVKNGLIPATDLYTIRVGELVRDPIRQELRITDEERIKIREKMDAGGCIYYDEEAKACRIYEHRPAQCSALACWDDSRFMAVFNRPGLTRNAVIDDPIVSGLIEKHEIRCGYRGLDEQVMRIRTEGEKAVEQIISIVGFDLHLRSFLSEKGVVDPGEMDLVFGRPLVETIAMFGLRVIKDPDGSFFLTACRNSA